MSFLINLTSDSCENWTPSNSTLIIALPDQMFFKDRKWGLSLNDISCTQSLVNLPTCDFEIVDARGLRKSFTIQARHVDSIHEVLEAIMSFDRQNINFQIVGSRLYCETRNEVQLELSPILTKILGFQKNKIRHGDINVAWDIWAVIPSIFVKWDVIEKQIVNDAYVKFIRSLPGSFRNVRYGDCIYAAFNPPQKLVIESTQISKIRLSLVTSKGESIVLLPNAVLQATFQFIPL